MDDASGTDRAGTSSYASSAMGALFHLFCNGSGYIFQNVNFYISGGNMSVQAENENAEYLVHMLAIIKGMASQLCRIERAIPTAINHTNANALIIRDALDEKLTVPWSVVRTYEALHRFLETHFEDKIGEEYVRQRRYSIARTNGGTVVRAAEWEGVIEKCEELTMFMILGKMALEEAWKLCPKCGKTKLGTYEVDGWNIWYVYRCD
ncbi:hypothetical protein MD484_g7914, partial [Candolleomyces efflorescens]